MKIKYKNTWNWWKLNIIFFDNIKKYKNIFKDLCSYIGYKKIKIRNGKESK